VPKYCRIMRCDNVTPTAMTAAGIFRHLFVTRSLTVVLIILMKMLAIGGVQVAKYRKNAAVVIYDKQTACGMQTHMHIILSDAIVTHTRH
jgi:hypothetical protein